MIPFPPFEPDKSIYTGARYHENVQPIADGWGPTPSLEVISTALASTCLGAWYARSSAGSYRLFAGTATKLYEFNSGTLDFDDISGALTFAVPDGDEWSAIQFGDTMLFTNLTDGLHSIDVDAGVTVAAVAGAPAAKYVGSAGDYLVLAHVASFPNQLYTSGINDASYWTVGQRGCDFQDFPTGEEITGIISAEKGALITQRTTLRTMTIMSAGEFSFRTDEVNNARGCVAPLSLVSIAPGRFMYYSADGWFEGIAGIPRGQNRVDAWFDSMVDRTQLHKIKAKADPFTKIMWIRAPLEDSTYFSFGYNWALDKWVPSTTVAWTNMAALATPAVTIDGLDTLYATIDDVDIPFDSRLLTGGVLTMAVFDSSNRLCYLTGANQAAVLQTADVELFKGHRAFVSEAMLAGDCSSFTLTAVTSDKYGGTRTEGSAISPYSSTGICHFRSDGRFHSFKADIAAGAEWEHVFGVDNVVAYESGDR